MKYAKNLLFLLCIVLLTGCIKDDLSDCDNVLLRFTYLGDGATDIFRQKIERVNLYVFDAETHTCVLSHTLNQSELDGQEMSLRLAPGSYQAVCIGNAYESTKIERKDGSDFAQMRFRCQSAETDGLINSTDPLYHSLKDFVIPEGEKVEELIPFKSSHIDVVVEVKGYVDEVSASAPGAPVLKMDKLPAWTDFENTPSLDETVEIVPVSAVENGSYVYRFNIMRNVLQSSLHFCNSLGEELDLLDFPLKIAEFVENNKIDLSKQEALLPILIEFKSLQVEVTIPEWAIESTKPEF